MTFSRTTRVTLVIDPRFGGGTSAAVAREIIALAPLCQLSVAAISSKMFKGDKVHPLIAESCEDTGTPLTWDPEMVTADVVALHNPVFLKFNKELATRIFCDRLFVVCHENFLRPGGAEGFDVAHCLGLISDTTMARRKYLAPVSGWNRKCAEDWLAEHSCRWEMAPVDWTNICDFEFQPPTEAPCDRRGRHSRPGLEKFTNMQDMEKMFPEDAEAVRILGGDSFMEDEYPDHWDVKGFGTEDVDDFLSTIDFFVYFTNPMWQESFGRVIAEAIAAGKVVITCSRTALTFGDGVVAATPDEVDAIIEEMIADPARYHEQVRRGQKVLDAFSATAFQDRFTSLLQSTSRKHSPKFDTEALYDFL